MSYAHLIFGILIFIVFTVTGRYMRADFPDKDVIDQSLRILMRSRHIYILFSALVHLGLGMYLRLYAEHWRRAMQIAGSALLFASSLLLVSAFVVETYHLNGFSDISRYGIYTSLAGIILHLIARISQNQKP